MTDLAALYRELADVAPQQPGAVERRLPSPSGMVVRATLDGVLRTPGLEVSLPRAAAPADFRPVSSRGLGVNVTSAGEAGAAIVTWRFRPAGEIFVSPFSTVASDLARALAAGITTKEALKRLSERLALWARFFEARADGPMSRSKQLGLIGELLCLKDLAEMMPPLQAITAWVGPEQHAHDFEFPGASLEVKLTTSQTPERFRITSTRQLDDTTVPALFLYGVLAQEVASGEHSVSSLVAASRSAAANAGPEAMLLLEDRLIAAGYADTDAEQLGVRVSIRRTAWCRVAGDFPRLLPAMMPAGIGGVSYDIGWAAAAAFQIDPSQVTATLAGHE